MTTRAGERIATAHYCSWVTGLTPGEIGALIAEKVERDYGRVLDALWVLLQRGSRSHDEDAVLLDLAASYGREMEARGQRIQAEAAALKAGHNVSKDDATASPKCCSAASRCRASQTRRTRKESCG